MDNGSGILCVVFRIFYRIPIEILAFFFIRSGVHGAMAITVSVFFHSAAFAASTGPRPSLG